MQLELKIYAPHGALSFVKINSQFVLEKWYYLQIGNTNVLIAHSFCIFWLKKIIDWLKKP